MHMRRIETSSHTATGMCAGIQWIRALPTNATETWMTADQAAHAATTRLYRMRIDYLSGRGPNPTEAEHQAAEALHARAARLHDAAMQEFDQAALRGIKPD
jgi:hypothetical protein